jgi:DNA helicase-2/ATP-dependent DNA helicase PcrA
VSAEHKATPYYRVDPEPTGEQGREVRIFGPPGTGKTTFLSGSVRNTALLRGPSNIVVASFTVTAAAELKGRGLPLPKSQIGTLHSLAYRELDRPPVADELLDDWNSHHPAYARSASGKRVNMDDGAPVEAGMQGATDGDALAAKYDALRNRMVDRDDWPRDVIAYADRWEDFKSAQGVIDFTDMIELALQDVLHAPGRPDVGFFDEVQDFTPLELALIRKWGRSMERVILAGDDDQAIYGFKGAEPDAFLRPDIPDHDKIVLSQSWRIPASVHRAAEHWIRQVTLREEKRYDPRAEEGLVRQIAAGFQHPMRLADYVEKSLDQMVPDDDAPGGERPATVMILATCGYMLDPVKHEMRKRGLTFHNPYRLSRGDWNPIRAAAEGQVTSRERLLAYLTLDEREDVGLGDLSRPWSGEDIRRWAHVIKKQGIFKRGIGSVLEGLPNRELSFDEVAALFASETELEQAVTPDLKWFERNLLASSRAAMTYPVMIARQRGAKALMETPRVVLGTIHSVKGGQADVVYLIPDLSSRGSNEWRQRGGPQDGVRRQMYVGMTRARRELVVCAASTGLHVSPEQLVAGARANAA